MESASALSPSASEHAWTSNFYPAVNGTDAEDAKASPSSTGIARARRSHRGKRGGRHVRSKTARGRVSDVSTEAGMSASSSSGSLALSCEGASDTDAAEAQAQAQAQAQAHGTPKSDTTLDDNRSSASASASANLVFPVATAEDAVENMLPYAIAAPNACPEGASEYSRRCKDVFNTLPAVRRCVKKRTDGYLVSNVNNFVKAALIMQFVGSSRTDRKKGAYQNKRVIDLGCNCNKDIAKYIHGKPCWVLGVDIAEVPFVEGERRWKKLKMPHPVAFMCADFTAPRWWQNMAVRLHYSQPERVHGQPRSAVPYQNILLSEGCVDVVSAQMSMQYAFRTEETASNFLDAVATLLSKDGYFIGTMPDIEFLRSHLPKFEGRYSTPYVTIECEDYADITTFTPYTFKMNDGSCEGDGIVEHAVEMTKLIEMCQARGLRFVLMQNYVEYLKFALKHSELRYNTERMNAFNLGALTALPQFRGWVPADVASPSSFSKTSRTSMSPSPQSPPLTLGPESAMNIFDAMLMFQVFCFQKM